jgi:hypothetical protein
MSLFRYSSTSTRLEFVLSHGEELTRCLPHKLLKLFQDSHLSKTPWQPLLLSPRNAARTKPPLPRRLTLNSHHPLCPNLHFTSICPIAHLAPDCSDARAIRLSPNPSQASLTLDPHPLQISMDQAPRRGPSSSPHHSQFHNFGESSLQIQ